MKRREFLNQAVVGMVGGGALLAGCSGESASTSTPSASTPSAGPGVQTRKRIRWRLASSFPRTLDTIFGAAEILADRVKELTDGNFEISVYPAGELVPGFEVFDAVRSNSIPIAHSASYYFIGKNEAFAFDTAVPFGLTTRQQSAWLAEGGGLELMRALFADFNIVNYPGGNTGVQMGGWFRREIGSVADLKGLKMRIPGLGGKVMDRLGVNVQVLPGGEIYQALEQGTIDATEWVGPYDDQKLGFHQVAKIYHYPGWWEPGPSLSFYVNKSAHDALPSTYRAALATASAEAAHRMQMQYDAKNPIALQELLREGVQLKRFPDDMMHAARNAMDEYAAEQIAANADYRKIHEQWSKFKKASDHWLGTAEHAYSSFVLG